MAESRPNARDFVGSQSAACPRPAHHDGLIGLPASNLLHSLEGHVRPVSFLAWLRAEILHLVTALLKLLHNRIHEMRSLVSTHCELHLVTSLQRVVVRILSRSCRIYSALIKC